MAAVLSAVGAGVLTYVVASDDPQEASTDEPGAEEEEGEDEATDPDETVTAEEFVATWCTEMAVHIEVSEESNARLEAALLDLSPSDPEAFATSIDIIIESAGQHAAGARAEGDVFADNLLGGPDGEDLQEAQVGAATQDAEMSDAVVAELEAIDLESVDLDEALELVDRAFSNIGTYDMDMTATEEELLSDLDRLVTSTPECEGISGLDRWQVGYPEN